MTEEEATTANTEEGNATDANATEEAPIDPATDTLPGLLLGIQAMLGTVWWVLGMFIYVATSGSAVTALQVSAANSIPLVWMFGNLGSTTEGWMAGAYFAQFLLYLIVSVVELVAWIVYMTGSAEFASLWIGLIGYWGSLIAYALPPIFALLHLLLVTGGLSGVMTATNATNDLFLMIVGFVLWVAHGLLHILFVPRFLAHTATMAGCKCSVEEIAALEDLDEDADDEAKQAHETAKAEAETATAEREAKCLEECPPKKECALERLEDESDEDFEARCEADAKAAEGEKEDDAAAGGDEETDDGSGGDWE